MYKLSRLAAPRLLSDLLIVQKTIHSSFPTLIDSLTE